MKATFLGTGTSQGVPVIGCTCAVCTSTDSRDNRLRSAMFLTYHNLHLVIDAGPDFRQQMLRARQSRLDGILLTHEHNDHVAGLDDVRPFNFSQNRDMPIYAERHVLGEITTRFAYAFDANPYPGAPRFDLQPILERETFFISGHPVIPIRVWHGKMPVLGFRFGNLTYITDAKRIDDQQIEKIKGSDVLILNALRLEPHASHLHLEAAIELSRRCGVSRTYFTHISHALGTNAEVSQLLPDGFMLAHDQLIITV
ncbi:MAG: MBL fold metallo-hydrolase [Saprospiraceae bacterium]|nr:MBL fold metallo-hydrolase [Saprospiraceae bacterium]